MSLGPRADVPAGRPAGHGSAFSHHCFCSIQVSEGGTGGCGPHTGRGGTCFPRSIRPSVNLIPRNTLTEPSRTRFNQIAGRLWSSQVDTHGYPARSVSRGMPTPQTLRAAGPWTAGGTAADPQHAERRASPSDSGSASCQRLRPPHAGAQCHAPSRLTDARDDTHTVTARSPLSARRESGSETG